MKVMSLPFIISHFHVFVVVLIIVINYEVRMGMFSSGIKLVQQSIMKIREMVEGYDVLEIPFFSFLETK
jgi:hypothetical protein